MPILLITLLSLAACNDLTIANQWQEVSDQLAVDYEQFTESRLIFRILPANKTSDTEYSSLESAYKSQQQSCSGRGANILHRDLLLSPAVLHLITDSFASNDQYSTNQRATSARYLFFAHDKRRGEGGSTPVWLAEWLPSRQEINFDQLTNADANNLPRMPFFMVHLCAKLVSRLRLPSSDASDIGILLSGPALPLSIGASVLSCLLLCLMLWSFASLTRRLRSYQQSLMFTYQSGFGYSGSGCRCSTHRVKYNGSVSVLQNSVHSSIEARMEHERRMQQLASYYY